MDEALRKQWTMAEQDQRISEAIEREQSRLRNFIRKRVADQGDAEDVLQDVFYELVEAYRLMKPIEQVTAWLYKVARNRITDLFRKKKREVPGSESAVGTENGQELQWEDLLPSPDADRSRHTQEVCWWRSLTRLSTKLPKEQREVFIGHELAGYSFKELAAQTGVSVNTLLSRKHYAVQHLRQRLQSIYEDFKEP